MNSLKLANEVFKMTIEDSDMDSQDIIFSASEIIVFLKTEKVPMYGNSCLEYHAFKQSDNKILEELYEMESDASYYFKFKKYHDVNTVIKMFLNTQSELNLQWVFIEIDTTYILLPVYSNKSMIEGNKIKYKHRTINNVVTDVEVEK